MTESFRWHAKSERVKIPNAKVTLVTACIETGNHLLRMNNLGLMSWEKLELREDNFIAFKTPPETIAYLLRLAVRVNFFYYNWLKSRKYTYYALQYTNISPMT